MSAVLAQIGALIAGHIKSLDDRVSNLESGGTGGTGGTSVIDGGTAEIVQGTFTELDGGDADL